MVRTAKIRPILFSPPMVRAILAGTKTQTRRVVKPQGCMQPGCWQHCAVTYSRKGHGGEGWYAYDVGYEGDGSTFLRCPYRVGERLWVKEGLVPNANGIATYSADGSFAMRRGDDTGKMYTNPWTWKKASLTALYMPRWASRLTLEITGVRVERVQSISEWDARAEGLTRSDDGPNICAAYRALWDLINKPRGFGWDANPWCWCISFKKV